MPILLPDQNDVAAFGDFLRHAREQRGLTLQEIARETRIPWRHLDALEHGNLAAVPSGMYRRAEIRAYADAVGLDRSLALEQLEHALEVAAPARTGAGRVQRTAWSAASGGRITGILGAAAVALVVGVAWWDARGSADTPAAVPDRAIEIPAPPVAQARGTDAARAPETEPPPVAEAAGSDAPGSLVVARRRADGPPPQTAAPLDVALVVTTAPAGARVIVDGIGWGTSPVTVRHLAPGTRRVRVVKDGFIGEERSVRVGAGREPASVTIALQPAGTP
jgi:cytoskeletal protein RodZ